MASLSKIPPEEALSRLYNFVIIGGGTAGLARLTEETSVTVLVLKARENRHNVHF